MLQYVIAMSINSKTKSKIKKGVAVGLGILAIGAIGLGCYQAFLKPKSAPKPTNEATKEKSDAQPVVIDKTADNNTKNYDQAASQQQQSTSAADSAKVTITYAGQNGPNLAVSALVSGATSGTCNLTATKGSTVVTKSAPVGYQVSYYICQGFDVPTSEFAQKGEWNVAVELVTASGSVKSETKKVNIQ
jgi:hypothetical protein